MTRAFISLKEAFKEWIQLDRDYVASNATASVRKITSSVVGQEIIDGTSAGTALDRVGFQKLASVFGRRVRMDGLTLIVSATQDDAAKVRLDKDVWPEGPFCWPLALHSRISNHRPNVHSKISERTGLEIYHGFWTFLDAGEFSTWKKSQAGHRSILSERNAKQKIVVRAPLKGDAPSEELGDIIDWFKERAKGWPKDSH